MQRTFSDFVAVWWAVVCFGAFFVPPGYLFGHVFDVERFRARSLPERLLWAVGLSTPISILLTVFSGRYLGRRWTSGLALALLAAWLFILLWQAVKGRLSHRAEWDRPVRVLGALMLLLALYCTLATLGITVGHKLYEGTYAGDWSVRIPLTAAAIRSDVPIPTPFYGVDGQSAPLRYYYYWYALCGAVGRLGHLSARPVLAASSVWSGFALFAALFLMGKYLFLPSQKKRSDSIRRLCVLMVPVSCILGLDVVPSFFGFFARPVKLCPELEWWRSQGDFSMSFHTAILYAPHHTAGLACCMLGFLLVTRCARADDGTLVPWQRVAVFCATAGLCFAAAVGTSTYLTFIFVIVCALLALERAQARDWRAVAALALTGAIALPLASGYIHEILNGTGASLRSEGPHTSHARFIAFFPRNVKLPRFELIQMGHQLHYNGPLRMRVQLLMRPWMTLLLYVIELGFFGFVLAWRGWQDLRTPGQLTRDRRIQWVLFAGLAFPALLLTSEPVIGVNDLGRHAGLALRFMAVLWATPLVAHALRQPRNWPCFDRPKLMRLVYASIALGLCAQVWQVVIQRSYLFLVDRGAIQYPFAPFPRFPHYGSRYFQTREAMEAIDRVVPPDGRIQYNPGSTYWTLMSDYLERPVAAFDFNCEAGFGGDLARCYAAMPKIRALFGGGHPIIGADQKFEAAGVSAAAFQQVCAEHHLEAVVATAADRVWPERDSWLWTRPALFSNASMRVVACPK